MIVTFVTAAMVNNHLKAYLSNDHKVVTSRDAQRTLYELAIVMQDAENGARGFALSQLPRHQTIFERSIAELESRMTTAEKAVQALDEMRDFGPLKGMVTQRIDMLKQMVSLASKNQQPEAAALLNSDETDRRGLAIRQEMEALITFANRMLEERLSLCRQSMLSMRHWVLGGIAVLVISGTAMVLGMIRDVKKERRTSAELRRARDAAFAATQARDDFLNVLSHELRTPLTPALLSVSGMERREPTGTEARKELTMIRRQLELEARLIDDLLDVSRILRGDVVLRSEQVSVHPLLKQLCDVFKEFLEEGSLKIECSLDAANDRVRGSESRLHQVFWHLLSNAVKFTPENGMITLKTFNENGKLIVTVSDTGVGMSEQQLPTIFEAFAHAQSSRTRMFGGLGVGLAIVKSVVEMHAGTVTVQSDGKDKGATFRVELPVLPRTP